TRGSGRRRPGGAAAPALAAQIPCRSSLLLSTDVNDAAAKRLRERCRTVVHVELHEDALDVRAGRIAADTELGRNLLVPFARGQQLEHLQLAARERGLRGALLQNRRNLRRDRASA